MKRQKNQSPPVLPGDRIKLRLNNRTIIIVRSMEAVKMWLTRFPGAQIIP
ncbi:MAG: hypothetical protein HY064_03860 [Bacteroidetes bacterium]|nr:hypothetical protein [Bacteroidota bacterium]